MDRSLFHDRIAEYFRTHPIVGILGPRQCGKTTLARAYIQASAGDDLYTSTPVHYFDLNRRTPSRRLPASTASKKLN